MALEGLRGARTSGSGSTTFLELFMRFRNFILLLSCLRIVLRKFCEGEELSKCEPLPNNLLEDQSMAEKGEILPGHCEAAYYIVLLISGNERFTCHDALTI